MVAYKGVFERLSLGSHRVQSEFGLFMLPLPFRTLLTTPQEAEDVVGRSEVAEDFVEAAVVDLGVVSEEDSEEVVEAAMRDLTAEEAALEAVG